MPIEYLRFVDSIVRAHFRSQYLGKQPAVFEVLKRQVVSKVVPFLAPDKKYLREYDFSEWPIPDQVIFSLQALSDKVSRLTRLMSNQCLLHLCVDIHNVELVNQVLLGVEEVEKPSGMSGLKTRASPSERVNEDLDLG
jgi:hypothetical protein